MQEEHAHVIVRDDAPQPQRDLRPDGLHWTSAGPASRIDAPGRDSDRRKDSRDARENSYGSLLSASIK
jgi:hypothetical protein